MFQGLINNIKSSTSSFIATYLVRASVAIPFIIALGLATAALGLELTEQLGVTNALWTLGAGYLAIGLVASFAVAMKEQQDLDAAEEQQRNGGGTESMSSEAAMQAATHLPAALLRTLLQSPSTWAFPVARLAGRNIPLVLLLLFVALLLWPTEPTEEGAEQEDDAATADAGGQEVPSEEERLREAA